MEYLLHARHCSLQFMCCNSLIRILLLPHFTDDETKGQKEEITFPKSHSQEVVEAAPTSSLALELVNKTITGSSSQCTFPMVNEKTN